MITHFNFFKMLSNLCLVLLYFASRKPHKFLSW